MVLHDLKCISKQLFMLGTSCSNALQMKKLRLMATLIIKKVNFSSTPLHMSLP